MRTSGIVGQIAGVFQRSAASGSDSIAPMSPTANRTAAESLRVILIGRTGLDARLRLDPTLELARAATPLEALGELAHATHGAPGTPSPEPGPPPVLLFAPSADPAFTGPNADREIREFVAAVRRLNAGARVLVVARSQEFPHLAAVDGAIPPDVTPEQLRTHIRPGSAPASSRPSIGSPSVSIASSAPIASSAATALASISTMPAAAMPIAVATTASLTTDTTPPAATLPDLPATSATSTFPPLGPELDSAPIESRSLWSDTGDEALVRSLMQGKDILPVALDLIKSRLGGVAVRFNPATDGDGSPVLWRGRLLGRLSLDRGSSASPSSAIRPTPDLSPHASWLGSWLAMRDQHQQLRQAAFTDPLTGANNRRFFDFFLRSTLDEAKANRRAVTLMLFDLDDFKRFNDQHGHEAGDEILVQTVRLLRSVIRPSDKVCRIGGDEFAVIFYDPAGPRTASSQQPSQASQMAERFQREIRLQKFPKLGDQAPGQLTVSAGLATYPWDGRTAEDLVRAADALAMKSKRQGKNAITLGPSGDAASGNDGLN